MANNYLGDFVDIVVCDICCEPIRANGHILTFNKRISVFDDIEAKYDVCDKCYTNMITLWNRHRTDLKIIVSK